MDCIQYAEQVTQDSNQPPLLVRADRTVKPMLSRVLGFPMSHNVVTTRK